MFHLTSMTPANLSWLFTCVLLRLQLPLCESSERQQTKYHATLNGKRLEHPQPFRIGAAPYGDSGRRAPARVMKKKKAVSSDSRASIVFSERRSVDMGWRRT